MSETARTHTDVSADPAPLCSLSSGQRSIWIDQLADPGSTHYNTGVLVIIDGPLDAGLMGRAVEHVATLHDALRTVLHETPDVPEQSARPRSDVSLTVVDVSGQEQSDSRARAHIEEVFNTPFDLHGGFLWRSHLVRVSGTRHYWLQHYHHLIVDGVATILLFNHVIDCYNRLKKGEPLPSECGRSHLEIAAEDREYIESRRYHQDLDFWRGRLAQLPPPLIHSAENRSAKGRPPADQVPWSLARATFGRIGAFCSERGFSVTQLMLALVSAYFARANDSREVVLGLLVHNRGLARHKATIGMFASVVPVTIPVDPARSFGELLESTAKELRRYYRHQRVSATDINRHLQLAKVGRQQVFDVMLSVENFFIEPFFDGGETTARFLQPRHHYAQVPLGIHIHDWQQACDVLVDFDFWPTALTRDAVELMRDRMAGMIDAVLTNPDCAIEELPFLSGSESASIASFSRGPREAHDRHRLIHELIESQVEAGPQAIALIDGGRQLTYREVNDRANQLAHRLVKHGVGSDDRVALFMERSAEMVIAILGVLKAGGAYVPIDPSYPADRVERLLADAQPRVVLTQPRLSDRLPPATSPVLALDPQWTQLAHEGTSNIEASAIQLTTRHLAYVIYTSGSTGEPKGAMNEHRAVVNRLLWMQENYELETSERVLQKTPYSFDVSVWEFLWTLMNGACLVVARPEGHKDPAYLRELIDATGVTRLHFVPSMLQSFLEGLRSGECGSLRHIVCSGEELPVSLQNRCLQSLPQAALSNLYGPTEAAVDVTSWECCETPDAARVPIGRPIANTNIYILDGRGSAVGIGVTGEIFIGGAAVARGYLNRPELTEERFVPDPFARDTLARMYRTGDLGRWRTDGSIEYLGRNDHQVKIRGFRIELGEIEAQLSRHEGVREVVVLAREDVPGGKRLVAYFTARDAQVSVDDLRAHVKGRLPEHMLPAAYVRMDSLPLSSNGKVDRRALPAPDLSVLQLQQYEAPRGEIETTLAKLWQELLPVECVGRGDNFFELGGHSLLAVQLIERLRRLNIAATARAVFGIGNLAELAAALESQAAPQALAHPNLIPAGCTDITPDMLTLLQLDQEHVDRIVSTVPGGARNVQDVYPLSPLQEGIHFHHLLDDGAETYILPVLLQVESRERLDAFLGALQSVIDRHDVLRTAILWKDLPQPVQVVWRDASLSVEELKLDVKQEAVAQLSERLRPEWLRMDLTRAPLIQVQTAHDLETPAWYVLLQLHHLIIDHVTLEILLSEVTAGMRGQLDSLGDPVPYRQFVAHALAQAGRDDSEAFFRAMLSDVDEPTLPFGLTQVHGEGAEIEEARLPLEKGLADRIRRLAQDLRVSAATLFHVAWSAVVAHGSGRDDVVFGSVLSGRLHGVSGAHQVLGMFINTLPLRLRLNDQTVGEMVRQAHQELTQLLEHEQTSLVIAQSCSGVSGGGALFSAVLNYRHSGRKYSDADFRILAFRTRNNYALTMSVDDLGAGGFELHALADARAGAQRMTAYALTAVESLVEALQNAPETAVLDLNVVPPAELNRILQDLNATAAPVPQDRLIHELFEAQADKAPDDPGVTDGLRQLTYRELNERANQLAHALVRQGVGPNRLVALFMERGIEMVVAMLAVLKAGGAYVPIDPTYPKQRVEGMLADAQPVAIVTHEHLLSRLPDGDVPVLALDEQLRAFAGEKADNIDPRTLHVTPNHLAYVLYTSGSTGAPKAVMVEHRNLVNYAWYAAQKFDVSNGSGSLICTSLAFDLALTGFYPPLICGRPLHLCDGQDLDVLASAILNATNLAPVKMTPSHFAALQQAIPEEQLAGHVRVLVLGGEPIARQAVQQWMKHSPGTRVFNHYGPTEATVGCAVYEIEGSVEGPIPIGRPVSNAKIYILDGRRRPVGFGVTGEIYIGGAGVAQGYLNRPELTAERFVHDPFSGEENARMYRTGDLGQWRPDGNIVFLGRNDQQVKIRGFRVELGEIEAQMRMHEDVREVAVLAREDVPGEKRLVAYFSGAEVGPSVESLRAHLKEKLPDYMLPAAYVKVERLPLTANGKLDRKALPAPDITALQVEQFEEPQGEIEAVLAALWQELLQVERVGRRDNFFELGGHSLLAVQLITRARSALGRDLALRDLFAEPTIRDLAKRLSGGASVVTQPMEKADRAGTLPLSHAQQRLWFVDRFEGAGAAYHSGGGLRLLGQLDRGAFRAALDQIVERHEILRTTFAQVDNSPVQVVAADATFALREVDLGRLSGSAQDEALRRHAAEELSERFDLSAGPLMRARLVRLREHEHVLLIAMHHIVSDGWSIGVFIKELGLLYAAARDGQANPLPPLPVQYADYAVWQRQWLQGAVVQEQREYWKEQLAGAPALLELPGDRPRPLVQSFRGGTVAVVLEKDLTARLNAFSRQHDVTAFMTLYAGFSVLLARLSGQRDIVIGSPLANRQREEVESLIGFFVNTLPLRIRLDDDPSVSALLDRVKEMTLAAYSHQDVPFEQIVEAVQPPRSVSHSPLYQVSLTWGNTPNNEFTLPGLKLARIDVPRETSQIDLSVIIREEGGRILGDVLYASELFDRGTIERWMRHFQTVLEEMLADVERPISRLSLLNEQDRRCVIEQFNVTADSRVPESMAHELFEEHVRRDPAAIALSFEDLRISYGELNRRANQLARYLKERGVQPETPVAICAYRGVEMMVGLLGILKAGAAYVPLDPSYPEERLAYMLEDAAAPILLTLECLEDSLPVTAAQVIAIDGRRSEFEKRNGEDLPRAVTGVMPANLAYIIYTSGSTGRPKGVMVEHRSLANLIHWHCEAFDARVGHRASSVAGFGFDAAVWEMWPTLCAGGDLVLPSRSESGNLESLLGWWQRQKLDISFLPTPAAEFSFNRGIDNAGLKTLLVGGDQLRHRPDASKSCRLVNNYGLTETTVVATSGQLEASEATAHIGRPVSNTQVYILDAHLQPVPIGVVGDLYIGGASVARGYLNRDELTRERFVHDPFSPVPGARMYRTGDLGKWRGDGNIEFGGRSDGQVKIRGYRIELGEIESQLSRHAQVKEAVVLAREDDSGEKRLVAYVTYSGEAPGAEVLRTHLKASLPSHMIPAAFVLLQTLPLTPNGKVDRQALPPPESDAYALRRYEAPIGETEEVLAGIWRDLLHVERVGRHDSFFELGGHSLLAVQATARIGQAFQIDVPLAAIFESPSVAALAEVVVGMQLAQYDPADITRVCAELAAAC